MYGKNVQNLFGGYFQGYFGIFLPMIYIGFSEPSYFQPKKPFINVKNEYETVMYPFAGWILGS